MARLVKTMYGYSIILCDHRTKVFSHGEEEGSYPVEGNLFVQWDCWFDSETNTIHGSGYSSHFYNTIEEAENHILAFNGKI